MFKDIHNRPRGGGTESIRISRNTVNKFDVQYCFANSESWIWIVKQLDRVSFSRQQHENAMLAHLAERLPITIQYHEQNIQKWRRRTHANCILTESMITNTWRVFRKLPRSAQNIEGYHGVPNATRTPPTEARRTLQICKRIQRRSRGTRPRVQTWLVHWLKRTYAKCK